MFKRGCPDLWGMNYNSRHLLLLLLLLASCTTPKLTIALEPLEASEAAYLPLAAKAAGEKAEDKLAFRLRITNDESEDVTVSNIGFSFPGSSVVTIEMQEVKRILTPDGGSAGSGEIKAGETATWSNGRVKIDDNNTISNVVYLPAPAPDQLQVEVRCEGYTKPATLRLRTKPYTGPAGIGAYIFPISPADLKTGEYAVTSAVHWANGGSGGRQIYAHDVGVEAKDPNSGTMNQLFPDTDGSENEHYRIWRKPMRAMADGEVVDWFDGMETNDTLKKFPTPTPSPVTGNSFTLRHGDARIVYSHLIKGSLPNELMVKGAKVKAGQQIGLIGNSGNSSSPHIHIHSWLHAGTTALRGMPFKNGWVLDLAKHNPPNTNDPWQALSGRGIPRERVAVWPSSLQPGNLIPTVGIARSGDWANSYWVSNSRQAFEQKAQQLFDDKGRRLVHVATFEESGQRRWAGIARSGNWSSSFWTSTSLASFKQRAQDLFDRKRQRLIHVSTHVEDGQRYWIGIAREGTWSSSFWVSPDFNAFSLKAQALFDDKAQRLIWVETFIEDGRRKWVGIARQGDWASSFWVSKNFASFKQKSQQLFDNEGRRLIHLSTYLENGERRWIGIARSGDWANSFWLSPHLDHFNQTAQALFDEKGRRIINLEFLTDESGE